MSVYLKRKDTTTQEPFHYLKDYVLVGMANKNMDLRGLSDALDSSYEHTRRIVRGISVPSHQILRGIAGILGLSFDELKRLAHMDEVVVKHQDVLFELSKRIPSLQPLERVWNDLDTRQQEGIIKMAQEWARQNKAAGS